MALLLEVAWAGIRNLVRSEVGQDLAEYAFILLLIALSTVASVQAVATALVPLFATVTAAFHAG